jgi:hypothetical protein
MNSLQKGNILEDKESMNMLYNLLNVSLFCITRMARAPLAISGRNSRTSGSGGFVTQSSVMQRAAVSGQQEEANLLLQIEKMDELLSQYHQPTKKAGGANGASKAQGHNNSNTTTTKSATKGPATSTPSSTKAGDHSNNTATAQRGEPSTGAGPASFSRSSSGSGGTSSGNTAGSKGPAPQLAPAPALTHVELKGPTELTGPTPSLRDSSYKPMSFVRAEVHPTLPEVVVEDSEIKKLLRYPRGQNGKGGLGAATIAKNQQRQPQPQPQPQPGQQQQQQPHSVQQQRSNQGPKATFAARLTEAADRVGRIVAGKSTVNVPNAVAKTCSGKAAATAVPARKADKTTTNQVQEQEPVQAQAQAPKQEQLGQQQLKRVQEQVAEQERQAGAAAARALVQRLDAEERQSQQRDRLEAQRLQQEEEEQLAHLLQLRGAQASQQRDRLDAEFVVSDALHHLQQLQQQQHRVMDADADMLRNFLQGNNINFGATVVPVGREQYLYQQQQHEREQEQEQELPEWLRHEIDRDTDDNLTELARLRARDAVMLPTDHAPNAYYDPYDVDDEEEYGDEIYNANLTTFHLRQQQNRVEDQMFNNPANVEYDEEDEILARVLQESLNAGDGGFY